MIRAIRYINKFKIFIENGSYYFWEKDIGRACVAQNLASASQQPHYILDGCNQPKLMQRLVSMNRIIIPTDYQPTPTQRSATQRNTTQCNTRLG